MKKIPQLSPFWVIATAGIGLAIRHGPHFFLQAVHSREEDIPYASKNQVNKVGPGLK